MNIIVLKENLKEILSLTNLIINEKSSLPILKNILIEADNYIKIKATDLEIGFTSIIPGKIIEKGKTTIPLSIFLNIVYNLSSEKINLLTIDNNKKLKITTDNYKAKINTSPINDFPIIPDIENKKNFLQINISTLKEGISQIITPIQISNTHPELSGMFFNFDGNITFVGTDSFRLSEKIIYNNQFETNIKIPFKTIIPLKFLENILKNFKDDKKLKIYFNSNQILIESDKIKIISRLINSEFPEYKNYIPTSFKTEVITKKEDLINALKVTGLLSGKINEIKLDIEKSFLKIKSVDIGLGENEYLISCKTKGDNLTISFNYRYLLDGLKNVNEKDVFLGFNKENNPLVVKPIEDKSYLYILMPFKY